MSIFQNINRAESGDLTAEDLDALLQFPFQDYVSTTEVKKEVIDGDLPDIRPYGNLVLNEDLGPTSNKRIEEGEDSATDPAVLQECLSLNQTLQQNFIATLNQIQVSLEKNLAKQNEMHKKLKEEERLRTESDGKLCSSRPLSLFAGSYFRDIRGMIPPDNEDTIAKMKNCDVAAYLRPPKPWSTAEKSKLVNGVGANALNFILKEHKAKRDYLRSKLNDPNLFESDSKRLRKNIKIIEKRIYNESQRDFADIVREAAGNIDWMIISATDLEGMRSEEDCEMMWNNYMSIFVNKQPFSKAEDEQLNELVELFNGKNWDSVAEQLGTNRSAIQCIERYQTHLNKHITRKFWDPEEDEKLLQIIDSVKIGNFIPWNKVCCYMEGRTRHQIFTRYERSLNKTIEKGPWTKFEDALLLACINKFGGRWTLMKEFFPDRNTYRIRERYVNSLEPSLKIGNWSLKEDKKLVELFKKYGSGKWAQIAREMHGRTDNMCLVRMKRLKRFLNKKDTCDTDDLSCFDNDLPNESAPSKHCRAQNSKLKEIQRAALETLKTAVANIAASLDENLDMENLDLSCVSIQTLQKVQKELRRMRYSGDYESKVPFFSKKKLLKRPLKGNISDRFLTLEEESSEEEIVRYDEEAYGNEMMVIEDFEKIKFSDLEKSWVEKVLETKFQEENSAISYYAKYLKKYCRGFFCNSRESLELNLYHAYLQKEFSLPIENNEDSDDPKKYVWCDIDYNLSVCDVVRHFVQPNVSENQIMILAPNCTTLLALDRILASRVRLQRTAYFVDHSMPYIRYLTGSSKEPPKCIKCKGVNTAFTPGMFDTVLHTMKSKLLVIEQSMREAAMCETLYLQIQEEDCICDQLAKSKAQVDLLIKRFISLFFWPFFLSSSTLTRQQEKMRLQSFSVRSREMKKAFSYTKRMKSVGKRKKTLADEDSEEEESTLSWKVLRDRSFSPGIVRRSTRTCVRNRKSFSYPDCSDNAEEDDDSNSANS